MIHFCVVLKLDICQNGEKYEKRVQFVFNFQSRASHFLLDCVLPDCTDDPFKDSCSIVSSSVFNSKE